MKSPFNEELEQFDDILNKSGRNDENRRFLTKLREALPEKEWFAVSSWIANFYGYQQNWLLDTSRVAILLKSRQAGGSFTYAAVAVLWALFGEKTAIISIGQREADRVLEYAKGHCEVLVKLGSEWAKLERSNAERIILASRGSISSLPPSSAARGDSTNVILDEVAYYKTPPPDKVIEAAFAATTHKGYRIRLLSTPNGVGNRFYHICKNHKKLDYRLHQVTIHDAIAEGLDVSLKKCLENAMGDERIFSQQYECSFLDSEFQYIQTELIDSCSHEFLPESNKDDPFYGGLDIGRSNDLTVLITIQRCGKVNGKTAWAVRNLEKSKRTSDEGLKKLVADGFKRYNYRRLSLDCTGIGTFPADAMQKVHGISRVDPIMFTNQVKAELATGMRLAFAEKRIFIPKFTHPNFTDQKDVKLLKEDIASIQRIVTENANIKYEAPHTVQGHADRAWALALALIAGLTAPTYARFQ